MDENKQQEPKATPATSLSDIWQQLLGERQFDAEALAALRESIPTIASDPWSELLQAKGVEMVDLTQLHLHMSEQDVEQLLQLMQEQVAQHDPPDLSKG